MARKKSKRKSRARNLVKKSYRQSSGKGSSSARYSGQDGSSHSAKMKALRESGLAKEEPKTMTERMLDSVRRD